MAAANATRGAIAQISAISSALGTAVTNAGTIRNDPALTLYLTRIKTGLEGLSNALTALVNGLAKTAENEIVP